MSFAKVIVDLSLDRGFDYRIPPELKKGLRIGAVVEVPFGHSRRNGYVLSIDEHSDYPEDKLKELLGICHSRAHVPENLVSLGRWMADYYCCSLEQSIRTLLPAAVRSGKVKHKTRKLYTVSDVGSARQYLAGEDGKKSRAKQLDILKFLLTVRVAGMDSLKFEVEDFSESALNTLIKKELVKVESENVNRSALHGAKVAPTLPQPPTPEQKAALEIISRMLRHETESHVLLLHGVTNSGKTEVYLQAIAEAIEQNRSAIVLVPEISLTPQTVRRFRARFGDTLSVLHSGLSDGERFDEWNRINDGEVKIAIGARSALFAPFRNLGLIIVDEEHESSYKQSEAPRYGARDVAVMRGKLEHCAVILGSATPSAETMYNAKNGKYLLAQMFSQAQNQLAPHIRVIDQRLGGPPQPGQSTFFSPMLVEAVFDRIRRGEQSILFLNRRGYARIMMCEICGYEARCPDCSVCYTYSKKNQTLSCHLCGGVIPAPLVCPQCGSEEIRYSGVGTEKIEAVAQAVFHPARIGRMDSDTMRTAGDYEIMLDRFRRGELDILIGTQMIAKGLHFPNVTLVGLINADTGLNMADFRAPERTFQLITQVAGRAGRGDIRGEVLIQTHDPDNETIRFAAEGNFQGFSQFDLEFRKLLDYPPYSHLTIVHFRGENEGEVIQYASAFTSELSAYAHEGIKVSGPSAAPLERIKGKFRYMTIIRGNKLKLLKQALRIMLLHRAPPDGVEAYADVDAISML